ncbi:MAG: allophanate hydrolase-related protein [Actinomycetes bacterium]
MTGDATELFVNGTLMRGLALHRNLDGATFLGEFLTEPRYRLHSVDDVHPAMYEVEEGGVSVAGELYLVPDDVWVRVEAGEPPNLYRGTVHLLGHGPCDGILYPRHLAEGILPDISGFGGWRAYAARSER